VLAVPCTIEIIVHGNSARHGWVWLPNCDAGGLDSARLSPPASGRGRLLRYDTRCYFNVRSKADMSQLNLPHGNDKQLKSVKQKN